MMTYTVDYENMVENLNSGKDELLRVLEKDGFLTKSAEELCAKYILVLKKKGFFGRMFDSFYKKNNIEIENSNSNNKTTYYITVLENPDVCLNDQEDQKKEE